MVPQIIDIFSVLSHKLPNHLLSEQIALYYYHGLICPWQDNTLR